MHLNCLQMHLSHVMKMFATSFPFQGILNLNKVEALQSQAWNVCSLGRRAWRQDVHVDPLLHKKTKTPHPAAAPRCVDAGAELPGLPNPTLTGSLPSSRATAVLGKLGALTAREISLRTLKKKRCGREHLWMEICVLVCCKWSCPKKQ